MLIITIFAYYSVEKSIATRRSNLFEYKVQQAQADIKFSIKNYIQILKAGKALFKISDTISRTEWREFVESMEIERNFPGLQGVGYAIMLQPNEVTTYENKLRKEGFTDFKLFPEGERSVYSSILYLEPFRDRNLRAFGYDMYSDEIRREAMQFALENNTPAVSGKVELVQETSENKQPGFLIYLPLYRSNEAAAQSALTIKGFVYSPFRMYDFMQATLDEEFDDIDIKVFDGKLPDNNKLLYHKNQDNGAVQEEETISPVFKKINFNNRSWLIKYSPMPTFGPPSEYNESIIILAAGIIISLLIAFTVGSLSYARRRAIAELLKTKEMENKKDEFIGIASHELKTPLTSSRAYMELLKMTAANDDDKKLAGKALESINKLTILVNDLLDVTKIQAGKLKLNYTEFNIHTAVDLAIENVNHGNGSHMIIKKGIADPVYVKGDLIRLEQSIVNFLSNAIKYSPGADTVEIEILKNEKDVQVNVIDCGIGISPKDYDNIFEKFYRVEDLDENITGLGMGLHIAAEIIYRHNGKLWVTSELGKGSTFSFTIPLV